MCTSSGDTRLVSGDGRLVLSQQRPCGGPAETKREQGRDPELSRLGVVPAFPELKTETEASSPKLRPWEPLGQHQFRPSSRDVTNHMGFLHPLAQRAGEGGMSPFCDNPSESAGDLPPASDICTVCPQPVGESRPVSFFQVSVFGVSAM